MVFTGRSARASKTRSLKRCLTWSHRCERSRAWLVEIVSKLRRDELHESPIVRKSPKKSGTRVTRPSRTQGFETVSSPWPSAHSVVMGERGTPFGRNVVLSSCARRRTALESKLAPAAAAEDRKSTRLNSSHPSISYAVFCLKKKKKKNNNTKE